MWHSNPLQLIRNILPDGKLTTMNDGQKKSVVLGEAMKYLCAPDDGWLVFMEELLNAGADVHGYRQANRIWATPLWHLLYASGNMILYSTDDIPREIRGIKYTLISWLEILEKCGYNVSDYLVVEEGFRKIIDQALPDTLARVEIKAAAGEIVIEHEWAYL